jgi:hypothetical protein
MIDSDYISVYLHAATRGEASAVLGAKKNRKKIRLIGAIFISAPYRPG